MKRAGLMGAALLVIVIVIGVGVVSATHAPSDETVIFYDGSLGTLPGDQGMLYGESFTGPTQTISNGGVVFDTSGFPLYQAGYAGSPVLMPKLKRTTGYTITFAVQVQTESHFFNNDRAGFSLIALSDDADGTEPVWGIELGFWTNEVWAQDDDTQGGTLFTHAEGATFDTTSTTLYDLHVITDTYTLLADGVEILNGRLRDYSNFSGFPDPYETPNILFLGDDTTSAGARIKLDYVAISANSLTPAYNVLFLPVVLKP